MILARDRQSATTRNGHKMNSLAHGWTSETLLHPAVKAAAFSSYRNPRILAPIQNPTALLPALATRPTPTPPAAQQKRVMPDLLLNKILGSRVGQQQQKQPEIPKPEEPQQPENSPIADATKIPTTATIPTMQSLSGWMSAGRN